MNRPNILYFVVHDIGRHLGCYHTPVKTPNLDAFAQQGVVFTRAFCTSTACSPSRGCAMSGQYAHVSGGIGLAHMGWPLPDDVRTIVDFMREGGYETVHAGMEHERGMHANRYEVDLQGPESHHTDVGVPQALEYLETRDRSRPLYMNIGSLQPHGCTWDMADERYGGPVPMEDVYIPPQMPDHPSLRRRFAKFQAAIRFMDHQFGLLMEGLERLGYAENTIVVFTTDHGIAGPRSKGTLYDKGLENALLVRLPDRALAGTRIDRLIQNIDHVPTLLEAAGLPVPGHLPGKSYWPLLNGGDYEPHEHIFSERNFHGERRYFDEEPASALRFIDRFDPIRSVRTPEYHYIRYFDPTCKPRPWFPWEVENTCAHETSDDYESGIPQGREPRVKEELFLVAHDPLEFINLADRSEFRNVKQDLAARLQTWMEETDDFVLRDEVPHRYREPGFH